MTVENGCTIAEAETARKKLDELEKSRPNPNLTDDQRIILESILGTVITVPKGWGKTMYSSYLNDDLYSELFND